jgi:hypothetical protein
LKKRDREKGAEELYSPIFLRPFFQETNLFEIRQPRNGGYKVLQLPFLGCLIFNGVSMAEK